MVGWLAESTPWRVGLTITQRTEGVDGLLCLTIGLLDILIEARERSAATSKKRTNPLH